MNTSEERFTWNVQYASHEQDHVEEKGAIDYELFLREFQKFPWVEQLELANQLQKCSPTISVKDLRSEKECWVSVVGDRNDHGYLIGHTFLKEKKSFWGLGKPYTVWWLEIYSTDHTFIVEDCFRRFFERDFAGMSISIRKLDKFVSGEY